MASSISASIVDGQVAATYTTGTNTTEKTTGSDSLDKDAFLQILVAEMQYQDPLEPSTNTEWVTQMASFSQIESLNDISDTVSGVSDSVNNSSAADLVGKRVIIAQTDEDTGDTSYAQGVVEAIEKKDDGYYLSVNGYLYSIDDLYSVVDEDYYNQLVNETSN